MLRRSLLAFLLAAILAPPAYAHSLKELEDKLVGKEKDFQPVDVAALEFTLTDATVEPSAWRIFVARWWC
jgi:hypothetical protein